MCLFLINLKFISIKRFTLICGSSWNCVNSWSLRSFSMVTHFYKMRTFLEIVITKTELHLLHSLVLCCKIDSWGWHVLKTWLCVSFLIIDYICISARQHWSFNFFSPKSISPSTKLNNQLTSWSKIWWSQIHAGIWDGWIFCRHLHTLMVKVAKTFILFQMWVYTYHPKSDFVTSLLFSTLIHRNPVKSTSTNWWTVIDDMGMTLTHGISPINIWL